MSIIERKPIILNDTTIMLLSIFTKTTTLEDLWIYDYTGNVDIQAEAAKQLIAQFEDQWTPRFFMELRKEITKKLKEHDTLCNTSFEKEDTVTQGGANE